MIFGKDRDDVDGSSRGVAVHTVWDRASLSDSHKTWTRFREHEVPIRSGPICGGCQVAQALTITQVNQAFI